MKVCETFNVVDKKCKKMGLDEKQTYGVRPTGIYKRDNKKVEVFVKIKTTVQFAD